MKRLATIVVCSTLLFACNSASNSNKNGGCDKECSTSAIKQKAGSIKLTTEEFIKKVADISKEEWKYLGDKPAIIDFYADWCGPCRQIAPTIEEIAKQYNGQLYIYKVNVDESPELAQKFKISAIPTIMFIPTNGTPITERGVISMEGFKRYIKEILPQ